MNSVPLIQNVDKDSINTTIIALKKAINEIESVLGLDSGSDIDTSVFVKKSEVVDAVEADNLNPVTSNAVAEYTVDRIEVNNSQPVSSNAVANATSYSTEEHIVGYDKNGNAIYERDFAYNSVTFSNQTYAISDFPIPLNKIVKCDCKMVRTDNALYIYSTMVYGYGTYLSIYQNITSHQGPYNIELHCYYIH